MLSDMTIAEIFLAFCIVSALMLSDGSDRLNFQQIPWVPVLPARYKKGPGIAGGGGGVVVVTLGESFLHEQVSRMPVMSAIKIGVLLFMDAKV